MYSTLQNKFDETMARESIVVKTYISKETFTCFFRRLNDGTNQRDTMTMFYPKSAPVKNGTIITVNDENFIVLNQETIENTVYYKSAVIGCNGTISTQDTDVMDLPFYGSSASSVFPSSGGTSTTLLAVVSGKTEIITEDCTYSRKLSINDKFNAWGRTWQIQNIFLIDGICHVAIEVQTDQDISFEYGIRFIDIETSGYRVGENLDLYAHPTINGVDAEGELIYSSSNPEVATVNKNGTISFVGYGSVSFTIKWKEKNITVTTKETTLEEIQQDIVNLLVSKMGEVYLGLFDGECYVTTTLNGQDTKDIAWSANIEDFAKPNLLTVITDQSSGKITVRAKEDYSIQNKTFTLVVSLDDYDISDRQTVTVTSL